MKKGSIQAEDRKRVLAAIRMSQKLVDAEERWARLETESGEMYERMVKGKDLNGLRAMRKIFWELRPDFKTSKGFKSTRSALHAWIKDEEKMLNSDMVEAAAGMAEARRTGVMTVLDNLMATGYDARRIVADHLAGRPVGPIEEYKIAAEKKTAKA